MSYRTIPRIPDNEAIPPSLPLILFFLPVGGREGRLAWDQMDGLDVIQYIRNTITHPTPPGMKRIALQPSVAGMTNHSRARQCDIPHGLRGNYFHCDHQHCTPERWEPKELLRLDQAVDADEEVRSVSC